MNMKTLQNALDFRLMCEASDLLAGDNSFEATWDYVLQAFEDYKADIITWDRLKEAVKGYMLLAAWKVELPGSFNGMNYATFTMDANAPEQTKKALSDMINIAVTSKLPE